VPTLTVSCRRTPRVSRGAQPRTAGARPSQEAYRPDRAPQLLPHAGRWHACGRAILRAATAVDVCRDPGGRRYSSCPPQSTATRSGLGCRTQGGRRHDQGPEKNLPTREELRVFIRKLPFQFSLLIDSGGGVHAYLLFKEMWVLDTPHKRFMATVLLKRFQRAIQGEHSVILTFPVAAVGTVQTPDPGCRYTWHIAVLTCDHCSPHTTTHRSA
jgi:hypothetical protein